MTERRVSKILGRVHREGQGTCAWRILLTCGHEHITMTAPTPPPLNMEWTCLLCEGTAERRFRQAK